MKIIQVYPEFETYQSIKTIYLNEIPFDRTEPIVYGNFVASIDGRIAIKKDDSFHLPTQLQSINDTYLFMELRVQADCLITHAGYMRSLEAGILGDILNPPANKKYDYLPINAVKPKIIICSNSLEFTIPENIDKSRIIIATSKKGNQTRKKDWQKQGYQIIEAGDQYVVARQLIPYLFKQKLKRIYLCAGPDLLESCITDGYINRLYLTLSLQMLGSKGFLTLIRGDSNLQKFRLKTKRLIIDKTQPLECIFATFDCSYTN